MSNLVLTSVENPCYYLISLEVASGNQPTPKHCQEARNQTPGLLCVQRAKGVGVTVAPIEPPEPLLNAGHRCDRCGGRAYVLAIIVWAPNNTGELYFCAHDWRTHADAIRPTLGALIDERWQLNEHIRDDHWVEGKPAR